MTEAEPYSYPTFTFEERGMAKIKLAFLHLTRPLLTKCRNLPGLLKVKQLKKDRMVVICSWREKRFHQIMKHLVLHN